MAQLRRTLFASAPIFSREWLTNHALVIVGSLMMAAGYNLFIIPHKVVPGGIIGVAQLINHMAGLPVGLTAMAINAPILLLASRIMGPGYGVKTVLSMVVGSLSIDLLARWRGLEPIVPDVLVSTIFGGVVIGTAVAIIIRGKANAGGTSLVGQLMSRVMNVPVGRCMLYVDGAIVLGSAVVFQNIEAAPYAIIGIFAISRAVDAMLVGLDAGKALMIISNKHEEIRQVIIEGLDRGGTVLAGSGLFQESEERKVIFTALTRRETVALQRKIRDIDPGAFCMVFETSEVLGSGFKPWK